MLRKNRQPSPFIMVLVLGSFFISAASALGAAQQYQYANACYDCHGTATTDPGNPPNDFRPLDTMFRNITTGGFQGNHRTHMAQTTNQNVCGKCHGDTSSYTTGHMNDKIDMAANINTSPGSATYSRGVQFNWTSNQNQVGYCSSVNCHFQATTPVWGTANFTYTNSTTNDCSQCHGAPPSGGGTGAAGSHVKHDAYFKGADQCRKCHSDHVSETGIRFAHATSAGNAGRTIMIQLHDPADVAGGSYTGAGTNFLPSQTPTFGNCTNTYCHSDGKGNFATPTWGTAATGACGTCHGARNDAPPSPATPHGTHVGTAKGYLFACAKCHARTVKSTTDSTTYANISSYNFHVNKAKDVNFSALNPSGSWDGTNCTTTYCHSNASPYLGTNTPVTQAWSGTLDCGGCHNKAGDTIAGAKAWSAPHTKHINTYGTNANMTCNACHAQTASNNSTIANKANHVDGTKTVAWNAFANNAAPAYNLGTHQCQNVYCHGNGTTATPTVTVTWSGSFDCNGCHGGNAANPPASTPHGKHVGSSSPYRYSCAKCHARTAKDTTDATTFANLSSYAFHVNKVKDVFFNAYNPGASWSSPNCSSAYCHSIGNTNVNPATLPPAYGGSIYATPTWSGTVSCNSCHGRSTTSGAPDYPNAGAPGSPTSNSHNKHVISSNISCGECHEKTTKDGTTIRPTSPSYHVNKTTNDVFFNLSGNSKNGTYNSGAKTCSTTYCHGTGPSIAWGDATTCTSCHSANNSGPWNTSTAHKLHWEDATLLPSKFTNTSTGNLGTTGTYRFACASCHYPGTGLAAHASGPADTNGVAQVFFGYTAPGKNPTYTYGATPSTSDNGFKWSNGSAACTNTYCHSNGNGGSGATAVNWATSSNTADPNTRCATCHLYAAIATGKHGKHVGTYGYSCAKCHVKTTDGSTIIDKRYHVNKTKDVAWDAATDGGTPYSSPNCTNIYCHSQGQSATVFTGGNAPNTTAAWTGSMPADCTGCHGGNNATTTKMSTNRHLAHINYSSNVGRFIGCAECHAATAGSDTSIGTTANHVNKQVNVKFDNNYNKNSDAPTYNTYSTTGSKGYVKGVGTAVGSCNNVYCHSDGNINGATPTFKTIAWNGAPIGCDGCHGGGGKAHPVYASGAPASSTANSHVKHVEGSSLGCDFCHINTTYDSAIPPTRVKNGGTHLNRTEDVFFKLNGGKTGSYDSVAKTCSTTYCHGTGPSVAWGGSTTCASCHDASKSLALRHDVHYNSTTTFWNLTGNNSHTGSGYAFGCKNCHPTNQHAQGPATVNRDAGIATSGVSKITVYTENGATATDAKGYRYTPSGTCTATCHSRDGAGAAPVTAVNWGSAATGTCGICHNKAGDGSPLWSAPHTKHINTYSANAAFTCNACHAGTAASNSAIQATAAARNQHTNGVKDIQFNSWVNASATYPNTATGCSNTYCHSQGTSYTSPTHSAILWSGTMTCASCHTGGTASGPTYANGSLKANSHNKHVVVWGYSCEKCHYSTTTDGTTITSPANHVNQTYSLQASGGSVTFTVAVQGNPTTPSQCSTISCHGGNNATWGTTLNCQDCHTGATDNDVWPPFTTSSAVAIVKTGEWTSTGHGKAAGSYTSGNPAANFAAETKQCEFCHDPAINHNAGTNVFRLKNYSTPDWGRNGPCMVCHGTGSAGVTVGVTLKNGTKKVSSFHYGSKHGPSNNGGQFCWDCHDGHGDGNAYMIHTQVAKVSDRSTGAPTTPVATTFTLSAPPNAVWGDYVNGGNTGLCQVCHAAGGSLAHFRSDLYDANHNPGTRCTYCHSHSGTDRTLAFKPAGNCDLCHGYPPVRRNLSAGTVFRQGNYSSARFEDYTGGGGAHTIEKHIPATANPSQGWANCTVCHNQEEAGHTMQTPVTPSKVTIDVKDRRKFDYRRQLGPERYSGKLTDKSGGSNTNITGSCSNASCHFKPSKKWSNER